MVGLRGKGGMHIFESKQWVEDVHEILKSCGELLPLLDGQSILITGASGLICSSVVDLLASYNIQQSKKIKIIAAGRNLEKMKARFASWFGKDWLSFVCYEATGKEIGLAESVDYVIHGAGNAHPQAVMRAPVETMTANFDGLRNLLDYAREYKVRRVLYISSSEIYGRKEGIEPYTEKEYGFVDLLNPRNAYAMGKRASETLCVSYAAEYGVETVIVRPGHIYGPTASSEDSRVSSAWAYAVARGEDIVMKSDGSQLRSYCYCLDCASAILKILLKGKNKKAYNISNPDSVISIRNMGSLLAAAGGVKLIREAATEEERKRFNPMQNSSLDSTRLQSLGWRGIFDAKRGLAHTVAILKDRMGV